MTKARETPDLPRLSKRAKAWVILAGRANASADTTSLLVGCCTSTVYRVWGLAGIERRADPDRRKAPARTCSKCGHRLAS